MKLLSILFSLILGLSWAAAKSESLLPTLASRLRVTLPVHVNEYSVHLTRPEAEAKIAEKKKKLHKVSRRVEAPESIVVCVGVPEKLSTFVEAGKVQPLTSAIRLLVSKTYHRLSLQSSALVKKHGLRLDEAKSSLVLRQAVSAVGKSKAVLSNATGAFGRAVVSELASLNRSLTARQRATVASGFSTWLLRKHEHLQRLFSRILRQHGVVLTRPEVEEVVTHVLRRVPVTGLPPRRGLVRSVVAKVATLAPLSPGQRRALRASIGRRLLAFVGNARAEVDEELRRHGVSLPRAGLDRLVKRVGAASPRVMADVHRFPRREAHAVLARLQSPQLNATRMEGLLRDLVRAAGVLASRLAAHNVSALFTRLNVSADDNALFDLVRMALWERAGVSPAPPAEMRMRVRLRMSYEAALAAADAVKREVRREVARVAEVLASEVQVLSMDPKARVRVRVVAAGFSPRQAEERIRDAIAEHRFHIHVDGRRIPALPPPHRTPMVDNTPWAIMSAAAAVVAVILIALTVAGVVVGVRRRHRMNILNDDDAQRASNIPYAKVVEPANAYA